jgi:tetratricopeptide (TPR) repeat protein
MMRASLLALLACLAASRALAQAEAQDAAEGPLEEARTRLARGEALYDRGDHEGAFIEFQEVDRLLEGHPLRPLAVYNMARASERLHRYDDALELYRHYLDAPDPDGRFVERAQDALESLEQLLGTLRLTIELDPPRSGTAPRYEIWIDGRLAGEQLEEVRIPGGVLRVEVRAPGYVAAMREVTLASGRTETISLRLQLVPTGLTIEPFAATAALAGAFALVAAIVGPIALDRWLFLEDCGSLECRERNGLYATEALDAYNETTTALAATFDAAIALTLAGGIAAIVLAFSTDFDGSDAVAARGGRLEVRF